MNVKRENMFLSKEKEHSNKLNNTENNLPHYLTVNHRSKRKNNIKAYSKEIVLVGDSKHLGIVVGPPNLFHIHSVTNVD